MAQIHDLDQECEIQTSIFGDLLLVKLWECPECPDSPMESGGELRRVASGSRRVELIISEAPLGSWSLGGPLDSFLPFPSLRPGLDFSLGDGGREPQDWIGLFNEVATSVCFLPASLPASLSSQIIETPRRGFLSHWQARVGVAGALPLAQALVITGTPLGLEPTPTSAKESNCISSFLPSPGLSLGEAP